jgi:cytochrome P450
MKANTKKGQLDQIFSKNPQAINTATVIDSAVHARKRRILNAAFSEKAIQSAETILIK